MISIHAPPRGGRRSIASVIAMAGDISIHAPREGGDLLDFVDMHNIHISIHAPREGGDVWRLCCVLTVSYISIHAPREGGDLVYL